MDVFNNILFWIHLTSLGLGGAAAFGLAVVGSKMPTATAETRPLLFSIAHGLSRVGQVGIGLLIVTGPLLFWLKYSFTAPSMTWFGIKMALVVLLLVLVIYAGINTNRAEKGDRDAAKRSPTIGMAAMLTFVAIILTAVFAFE